MQEKRPTTITAETKGHIIISNNEYSRIFYAGREEGASCFEDSSSVSRPNIWLG